MFAFGPVPSRRLGFSLGINHVPPKHCSYSCVYCQVGRTTTLETIRRNFYPLDQILLDVDRKILKCQGIEQPIDYLSLVPDGEPTLDKYLGELIIGLKTFGIPIAVITNASLIDREEVQQALMTADWISLKIDAVCENEWHRINRPHRRLSLVSILNGIYYFKTHYPGKLVTETMLVNGINDHDTAIQNLSDFLNELRPLQSYLSIPNRPPAEPWVKPPDTKSLNHVFSLMSRRFPFVYSLFEPEDSTFISTGDIRKDILGINAVHPMRENALLEMINKADADWAIVDELLDSNQLGVTPYLGEVFYFRCFK